MAARRKSRRRNPLSARARAREAEKILYAMPIDAFEKFAYFVKRHSSTWKDEMTHDYPLSRAPREAAEILGSYYARYVTLPMVKRVALHRLRSGSPWLVVSGSTHGLGLGRRNPSDLEVREKFDRCVASVRAKSGKKHLTKAGRYAKISSPEAVCAASIRRTSPRQLTKIAAEGRSLAAARRHRRGLVRSRKTGRLVHRPASRLRPTAIQRRHQMRRVIRQQVLAKRRAMRNPAKSTTVMLIDTAAGDIISVRGKRYILQDVVRTTDGFYEAHVETPKGVNGRILFRSLRDKVKLIG